MMCGMATVNLNVRVEEEDCDLLDKLVAGAGPRTSRNAMAAHVLHLALNGGMTRTAAARPTAPSTAQSHAPAAEPPAAPRGLSERLRTARTRRGLRQLDVADAAGVHEDVVRRAEREERYFERYPSLVAWVEGQERAGEGADR